MMEMNLAKIKNFFSERREQKYLKREFNDADFRLTEKVKKQIPWMYPWEPLNDHNLWFVRELRREICSPQHILYGKKVIPLGHGSYTDDVLYKIIPGDAFAVVHLTHHQETRPQWPHTVIYKDLKAWIAALKKENTWHKEVAKEVKNEKSVFV